MIKQRGFTIVELLTVIAVIAILASIVVVAYTDVQKRSVNTSVAASLKNLGETLTRYKADKRTYPATPPENWSGAPADGTMVCLGEYSTPPYCNLPLNSNGTEPSGPGSVNGVNKVEISQDYAAEIESIGSVTMPPGSVHQAIDILVGYEGGTTSQKTHRIRGLSYGYKLTGSSAYLGVYIYYALYGNQCLSGDEEAGVVYGNPRSVGYNDWFSITDSAIFCRHKLADTLAI